MIRITPEAERIETFKKELWATQKVREAGVPSPEVLAVGNDLGSEPYMISRRVTGTEASHHPRRSRIVHEMGRYAQMINSIHTHDFGGNFDWTTNGTKKRTWADYIENEWDVDRRLQLLTKHKILSSTDVKKLHKIVEESKKLSFKPTLNHGDLRLKNVIVDDDGEIAAIIDWDDALSTIAPEWELSVALHDLSVDEKHLFIEGYGLEVEQVQEMAPLVKAFNMINYTDAIERAVAIKDHKALSEFRLRLSGGLDLYSLS